MSRSLFALFALVVAAIPAAASAQYYNDGYRQDSRYSSGATVRCESNSERTQRCAIDTRGGVRMVRQESRSPCIQGRTWGWDGRGIWVAAGCRARFEVGNAGYANRGYGYGRGQGYDDRYDDRYDNRGYADQGRYGYDRHAGVVRCESTDDRPRFCRVPGGLRQVDIVRRLSDSRCEFNRSWGYRRDGIWVERGCRAEFRVY